MKKALTMTLVMISFFSSNTWAADGDLSPSEYGYTQDQPTQQAPAQPQQPQQQQPKAAGFAGPQDWGAGCKAETSTGSNVCIFDSNPSVQAAGRMASSLMNEMKNATAANKDTLCGRWGNLLPKIDAATTAYKAACSAVYARCSEVCSDEVKAVTAAIAAGTAFPDDLLKVKEAQRECSRFASNMAGVQENVVSYFNMQQMKSSMCVAAVDPMTAFCKANPGVSVCQQNNLGMDNCSSPEAQQNNLVCICRANSADPRCGGHSTTTGFTTGGGPGGGGGSGATDGSGLGTFGGPGGGGGGGGFSDLTPVPQGKDGGGQNAGRGGGGGGGGFGGGGGGQNKNAGGPGGGPGGTGYNTKIIGGYGVGGSGGGSYATGSGTYGQQPGTNGRYGAGGAAGGNGRNVDLRQFMPGGKMDPSRGLAGIAGPDGITGPNSDIWAKVRTRYFSVSPSLLP